MQVDLHNSIVNHYKNVRILKSKKTIHKQSIVRQAYQKKVQDIDTMSPLQDFLRNQQQIAAESQPLNFRTLPRRLKVHFPGPPSPPPKMQQVPYTNEIVPKVAYKMPKQQAGFVGDWVLQQSYFADRKHHSLVEHSSREKFQRNDRRQTRQKFRSAVKKVVSEMKSKNLSLREVIKNKGFLKKPHGYYNSHQFLQAIKQNDQSFIQMLQLNPYLAFDVDDQKMTGLHWAARQGHVYICKVLLQKYRANPEARDIYGRTPLHLAVMKRHPQCMIRIFIEGGHLNSMNNDKKTIRMVATDSYTKYLLEKLEQAKYLAKAKTQGYKDYKIALQQTIRESLDQTTLYF